MEIKRQLGILTLGALIGYFVYFTLDDIFKISGVCPTIIAILIATLIVVILEMRKGFYYMVFRTKADKEIEVLGLFSREKDAVKRCTMNGDFLVRIKINEYIPEENVKAAYAYYPKLESAPVSQTIKSFIKK